MLSKYFRLLNLKGLSPIKIFLKMLIKEISCLERIRYPYARNLCDSFLSTSKTKEKGKTLINRIVL